jgi:O-antigen biosynthesis protein WbqP
MRQADVKRVFLVNRKAKHLFYRLSSRVKLAYAINELDQASAAIETAMGRQKRGFDLAVAVTSLLLLWPLLLVIAIAVKATSNGPVIHWSKRVGQGNRLFEMPKFRTMRNDTPQLATHLLSDPDRYLTPIGSFLRKSSMDELPQLWSVIKGDLTLVGPRPALFNQHDLQAMRTARGIHALVPGITGWAQINGRDEMPIPEKVSLDFEYLQRQTPAFDAEILIKTALKVVAREGVSH